MTEIPTIVVIPASALLAILGTVASLVRWNGRHRRQAKIPDRAGQANNSIAESARQETSALVENARASTLLAARVDALERSDTARRQLDQSIERLSSVISRAEHVLGSAVDQTEHVAQSGDQLDHTIDEAKELVHELRSTAEKASYLVDQLSHIIGSSRESSHGDGEREAKHRSKMPRGGRPRTDPPREND